jgi:4-hydroxybenzoate polyprenyltransferase
MYSLPTIGLKRWPVFSSLLHFLGGLLHFLMGYSLFAAVDWPAVAIAAFFALIFVAGHATQEVQDWASDRHNGVRTTAVLLGPVATFVAATALFAFAYAYLIALGLAGLVPVRLAYIAIFLLPIQLYSSMRVLRNGLGYDEVSSLREHYRVLFAIIGLGIMSLLVG